MKKSFDFIAKRKMFLIISACILGVALLFNIIFGTEMDISFKGGTLIRYDYEGTVDVAAVGATAKEVLGANVSAKIETVNNTEVITLSLSDEVSNELIEKLDDTLAKTYKDNKLTQFSSNSLAASMGRRFFIKCMLALVLAALLLLVYVGLRFIKIGGLSAGMFALFALAHDLLFVYFTFVIFRIPLNDNFVAVMLTILGYSLNDTIVIYDRIRENRKKLDAKTTVSEIVNLSLNQSFVRTRNTSITTGVAAATITVVALVLRMDAIVSFALPMLLGVVSGFYSSTFLSAPLWAWWVEHKEAKAALAAPKAKKKK